MDGGEEEGQEEKRPRSHLFTVRLWDEEQVNGQAAWRGKVQHVLTGETRPFHDWPTLISLINGMLPQPMDDGRRTTDDRR